MANERRSITIPLPTGSKPQILLVGLLIAASFFIGSLYTKVKYLEKNSGTQVATGQAVPQVTVPNQPGQVPAAQIPSGKIKPVTDKDHIRGNKDAKVSLVEYSDLECPFCKSFHPTMQEIMKTYGDDVKWVYRHYPLSFHANAQKEAEAAECVAEQKGNDAFWSFIDKIFERTTSNGTGLALDKLGPLAAEVGANQGDFQKCLDGGKYAQHVTDEMADGTTGGVSGTPSTFIVDSTGEAKLVVGAQPASAFKTVIDEALK